MASSLWIGSRNPKAGFADHPPDLSHLVGLCAAPAALQIDSLSDTFFNENVMTSSHLFHESQTQQEQTEVVESYVGVGATAQNSLFQFVMDYLLFILPRSLNAVGPS